MATALLKCVYSFILLFINRSFIQKNIYRESALCQILSWVLGNNRGTFLPLWRVQPREGSRLKATTKGNYVPFVTSNSDPMSYFTQRS